MFVFVIKKKRDLQRMAKRITIMLDDDLAKKLHEIQAKLIKEFSKYVIFSSVLNDVLHKNLK